MKFEPHASLTMPLDKIDEDKTAKWFDDCIVNFVQTVAAMHQNQYYLKDHLVTDPVAGVQMPKYTAKATLEADGKTYYFISDETKCEFAKQRGITSK
jgi:YHS domain-containing protein